MSADGRKKQGPVALVTGGGTGVGRTIGKALGESGYQVVISGRREQVLQSTAAELTAQTGGKIDGIVADVSNLSSVEALFEAVIDKFGRLDLLVNNAGILIPGVALEDVPFED